MSAHGNVDLGHTLAGWTGTAIALTGLTVTGVAVVAVSLPLALLGGGVLAVALAVTWLLHLAGWGKPSGPRPEAQWPWRVRDLSAAHGHPGCLGCRLAGRRPVEARDVRSAVRAAPVSVSAPDRSSDLAPPVTATGGL